MKVKVEDIPAEGLEVSIEETSFTPQELGSQVSALAGAVEAVLKLMRQPGLVQAQGKFAAGMELVCSRCLEPFNQTVSGELNWVFMPAPAETTDEVELADEDMDVSFYTEGELDLGSALRDELSLALPMAPLCNEDCPGLCPGCGKPAIDGSCTCEPQVSDPRWSKLAQLKIQ
jgi:uncharacterized protein